MSMILANPISPDTLLSGSAAVAILAVVLFAECGLLVGFFLPGDTLLFAAGIGLATGSISGSMASFLIIAPIAAFVGNLVGYWIGRRTGPAVFDRPGSRLFRPEYLDRTRRYFDRFGPATIIVARFVPVVRTVTTVLAGAARVGVGRFTVLSLVGAIVWTDGVLLLGRGLGNIEWVRAHKGWVDYAVLAAVVITLVPVAVHLLRNRRAAGSPAREVPEVSAGRE